MGSGFFRPGYLPDRDGLGFLPAGFLTKVDAFASDKIPGGIRYPATPAELATMMGAGTAPTSMWRFTQASGNATDLGTAGATLAPTNSPTQNVTDGPLGSVTVEFGAASTQQMLASAGTVLDMSTQSFAMLWVGRLMATPSTDRMLMGKRDSGGTNNGYMLLARSDGTLRGQLDGGATLDVENLPTTSYPAGNPTIVLFVVDRTANSFRLHSSIESSTGQTIDSADLTNNTVVFSVGRNAFGTSAAARVSMAAVFDGAGAVGLGASHVAALKAAMGL